MIVQAVPPGGRWERLTNDADLQTVADDAWKTFQVPTGEDWFLMNGGFVSRLQNVNTEIAFHVSLDRAFIPLAGTGSEPPMSSVLAATVHRISAPPTHKDQFTAFDLSTWIGPSAIVRLLISIVTAGPVASDNAAIWLNVYKIPR